MALQEQMYELFLLDRQVRGMRRRLDVAKRRLGKQETTLNQLQRQRTELTDQLKHSQVKAADLENEIRSHEQRIEHLRQQMNTITSNKEYSAVLVELNSLKEDKSKLEDETLNQMGEVDRVRQQIQELDGQVEKQTALVARAQQEVESSRADVEPQLDALAGQHAQAQQLLPAEAQETFRRLQDTHEGEAMASVTEENRRSMEYSCGGCYISIPVERVNVLMVDQDQIVCCPNCGRILYLDQELKTSIGSK